MLHRRISYAALLLAAVVFQIFFKYYLSTFVLVLVVLLPVLSVVLTLPALLGTSLHLTPEGNVPRGSEGRFTLSLERKNSLPLPPVKVRLTWTNQLTGESGGLVCHLLPQDGKAQLSIPLAAPHCGRLVCDVTQARGCDLLGLFPLPIPGKAQGALLSLPLPTEVLPPEELEAPRSGGVILKPRPGGGPGEDYDLREYRAGDSLRSIHWKLSSKKDELVVREALGGRRPQILLSFDLFGSPDRLDRVLARLWTASHVLSRQDLLHEICWVGPDGQAEREPVASQAQLTACMARILSQRAPETKPQAALTLPDGPGLAHLHLTAGEEGAP